MFFIPPFRNTLHITTFHHPWRWIFRIIEPATHHWIALLELKRSMHTLYVELLSWDPFSSAGSGIFCTSHLYGPIYWCCASIQPTPQWHNLLQMPQWIGRSYLHLIGRQSTFNCRPWLKMVICLEEPSKIAPKPCQWTPGVSHKHGEMCLQRSKPTKQPWWMMRTTTTATTRSKDILAACLNQVEREVAERRNIIEQKLLHR